MNKRYLLDFINYPNGQTDVQQTVQVVPGALYDLTFYFASGFTTGGNLGCWIRAGYNDNAWFGDMLATSAVYQKYTARFKAGQDASANIKIRTTCNTWWAEDWSLIYVDDVTLTPVALCDEYPKTGLWIENPDLEIEAPNDSAYAWFGTEGVTIKAGTSNADDPQPYTGNNFL